MKKTEITKCGEELLGPQASLRVTPYQPVPNHTKGAFWFCCLLYFFPDYHHVMSFFSLFFLVLWAVILLDHCDIFRIRLWYVSVAFFSPFFFFFFFFLIFLKFFFLFFFFFSLFFFFFFFFFFSFFFFLFFLFGISIISFSLFMLLLPLIIFCFQIFTSEITWQCFLRLFNISPIRN